MLLQWVNDLLPNAKVPDLKKAYAYQLISLSPCICLLSTSHLPETDRDTLLSSLGRLWLLCSPVSLLLIWKMV